MIWGFSHIFGNLRVGAMTLFTTNRQGGDLSGSEKGPAEVQNFWGEYTVNTLTGGGSILTTAREDLLINIHYIIFLSFKTSDWGIWTSSILFGTSSYIFVCELSGMSTFCTERQGWAKLEETNKLLVFLLTQWQHFGKGDSFSNQHF